VEVIRISEAKGSPKAQKKNKIRTQLNGKFNDVISAEENN
jgi:hypothetical protein